MYYAIKFKTALLKHISFYLYSDSRIRRLKITKALVRIRNKDPDKHVEHEQRKMLKIPGSGKRLLQVSEIITPFFLSYAKFLPRV